MNNYKKAVIVTVFDNYSYNVRTRYVEKILKDKGYTIDFLVADFDHREKKIYESHRQNIKLIKVPTYKKNMSFKRIYSHYIFSKKIVKKLQNLNPQLLYVITPPNMLFHALSKYYKMTKCILIYDIYDLWPESLPIKKNIKDKLNLFLNCWKNIRDKNIYNCDGVIYECELFEKLLAKKSESTVTKTIYLTKNVSFDKKISDLEKKIDDLKKQLFLEEVYLDIKKYQEVAHEITVLENKLELLLEKWD